MSESHDGMPNLSARDQYWLGRLIEAGFEIDALGPLADDERSQVEAVMSIFRLLEDYPIDDGSDDRLDVLTDATMLGIDRHDAARRDRMSLSAERERRGLPIRLPDFITVAASILIIASVAWPVLSTIRKQSIDSGCAYNMHALAEAFELYAQDYESLPVAVAGVGSGSWDQVRNILNLKPIVEKGYCEHGCLHCPGDHGEFGSSYSYQLQVEGQPTRWALGARSVVLGDQNPIMEASLAGRIVPPMTGSVNHGGRGQNILHSDGSTDWLTAPVVGSDNIWLPAGAATLEPGALHLDPNDTFLAH